MVSQVMIGILEILKKDIAKILKKCFLISKFVVKIIVIGKP